MVLQVVLQCGWHVVSWPVFKINEHWQHELHIEGTPLWMVDGVGDVERVRDCTATGKPGGYPMVDTMDRPCKFIIESMDRLLANQLPSTGSVHWLQSSATAESVRKCHCSSQRGLKSLHVNNNNGDHTHPDVPSGHQSHKSRSVTIQSAYLWTQVDRQTYRQIPDGCQAAAEGASGP